MLLDLAGRRPAPRSRLALAGAVAAVLALALVLGIGVVGWRAASTQEKRCERHAADAAARAAVTSGGGQRVVVIGDSYSVGLGLRSLGDSWPSRLEGRVRVAGFSGSGFSADASTCDDVDFADRAPRALRAGADLVVVEGGLNDFDQPDRAIAAGFDRLMQRLAGRRVVVVGPPSAPSRGAQVVRVDALLADLAARHDVAYVSTRGWRLPYLRDRLHLTQEGHALFGDAVAEAIAGLGA